jgi:glycosyltransferase involved in cell wall biosynthesis
MTEASKPARRRSEPQAAGRPNDLPEHRSHVGQSLRLSVLIPVYNERHVVETSVRRVLALVDPRIASLEVIIVDDRSKDGSWEVLQRVAASDPRVKLLRHERNSGKGAAVRTALAEATGDVTVIHDADLEYNPADIPRLLEPFITEGADAVFGSRYMSAEYRRALMFKHSVMNRMLTGMSNLLTDLSLTDMETCYKAVRTRLLKSIPLRSNDFRLEVEIVAKLAKRRAMIFEVPIRYLPRSYEEGKKIRAKDGILALRAMLQWWLIDDMYRPDDFGGGSGVALDRARNYRSWLAARMRPHLRDRILEVDAGIGALTHQFIPRDLYVLTEHRPECVDHLRSYSLGKPYLRVVERDAAAAGALDEFGPRFDTALLVGALERAPDERLLLGNVRKVLEPGGRIVVFAATDPDLFGPLDEAIGNLRRYTEPEVTALIESAGFRVTHVEGASRFFRPAWWFDGKVRGRSRLSRLEWKVIDTAVPALRAVDEHLPWSPTGVLVVAERA